MRTSPQSLVQSFLKMLCPWLGLKQITKVSNSKTTEDLGKWLLTTCYRKSKSVTESQKVLQKVKKYVPTKKKSDFLFPSNFSDGQLFWNMVVDRTFVEIQIVGAIQEITYRSFAENFLCCCEFEDFFPKITWNGKFYIFFLPENRIFWKQKRAKIAEGNVLFRPKSQPTFVKGRKKFLLVESRKSKIFVFV